MNTGFKCTRPLDIIYQKIYVKYLDTIYVYCILSHWQVIKIMLFVFNPHMDFIHMQKCPVRIIMMPGEMCNHCFLVFINKHCLISDQMVHFQCNCALKEK